MTPKPLLSPVAIQTGMTASRLSPELADRALPVASTVAAEHDLLAALEARLAHEVTDLVSAISQFSRGLQSISKELPVGSDFGQNVTLFFSLVSSHVTNALIQGCDKRLLIDDGAQQLRDMGLSLGDFVRELDLDGRRFLAVALPDPKPSEFGSAGQAGQQR